MQSDVLTAELGQDEPSGAFTKLYNLSDTEKAEVLTVQKERLTASVKYMERLYPQMIENYKKYRSIAEPLKDDLGREVTNRSNLFVPYPWAIVESELPRLAGKLPRIRVFPPKDRAVDSHKVEIRQDNLYYAFDRMNFLKTQTLWLRQFSIYGWSPLHFFWRQEFSDVLSKQLSPTGEYSLVRNKVKRYDDFWCRVLDVFDCFLQPNITEIEESDWFIFREYLSAKDIREKVEMGLFYEEALEYIKNGKTSAMSNTESGRVERDSLIGQSREKGDHAYGKYEVTYVLEDSHTYIMLDRVVLAAKSDNSNPVQEKSIINCNLMPMLGEPLGIGTIECLAGLPDKLNALSNSRLDNISIQLGKVFLANRNAQLDFDNLVMDSGNVILTDDINNSLKELEFSDQGQSSERETFTTKEELQFTSGVSDYIVGVNSGSRLADTATGVSTIVRESNARYALKQASYESGSLRKLVQIADKYIQLFQTNEKTIYINGPSGYTSHVVTPEDLAWDADIVVEPGSSAPLDQISRREGLMNLLDRVMKMPQVVNVPRFVKALLDAYDFRDADELVMQKDFPNSVQTDSDLAKGENEAVALGQNVSLEGDDQLHLKIHSEAPVQTWSPESRASMQSHMMLHAKKLQSQLQAQQQQMMMQAQLAGGMNAQNPNAPNQGGGRPPGPAARGPEMGNIPPMVNPAGAAGG
jgi:hypothetical protein